MNITQAVKKIVENWEKLEKENIEGFDAVWIIDDESEPWEIDEERIGILKDGSFVWAYASGCSCWMEDYSTATDKSIKAFELKHKKAPEEWEKEIIEYAEKYAIL
jgi:hypothetical protein